MNFFRKNEKYFYSDKVNFVHVLRKIYYEKYKYEDLIDYILHCMKSINTVREFFEILIKEANSFAQTLKKYVIKKINELFQETKGK